MADEIVLYLQGNCSAATINGWRAQVFAAHVASVAEPTVITGISTGGDNMAMTISATAADRLRFLSQCRQALALLGGSALPAGNGIKLDFSTRMAST